MFYNPLLKSFVEVIHCGSFSKAAQNLYISNTAIMKQMNQLEMMVGTQLLHRSPRGISLTEDGKYVYEQALLLIEQSDSIMRTLQKQKVYTIRIGSSFLDPSNFITDLWQHFEKEYPNYSLEIVPFIEDKSGQKEILKQLGRDYDVLAGCHTNLGVLAICGYLPIKKIPFTLAMHKNHPLSQKEIVTMEDLKGHTILIGDDYEDSPVKKVSTFLSQYPEIQLEFIPPFYELSTFNKCANSDKLLLSLPHWNHVHPSLIQKEVDWDLYNTVSILYSPNASQEVKDFISLIEKRK